VILVQAVLDEVIRPIDIFVVELIRAQKTTQRRRDLMCPISIIPPESASDPRIISVARCKCVLVLFARVETLVVVRVSVAEAR